MSPLLYTGREPEGVPIGQSSSEAPIEASFSAT